MHEEANSTNFYDEFSELFDDYSNEIPSHCLYDVKSPQHPRTLQLFLRAVKVELFCHSGYSRLRFLLYVSWTDGQAKLSEFVW